MIHAVGIVAALALTCLGACAEDKRTSTVTAFEGTWICVNIWEGSTTPSKETGGMAIRFNGNQIECIQNGTVIMTGTFATHKDTNPTQIDIVYRSEGKELRIPGIVQVAGSEMKLCHPEGEGGKRPDKFDPSAAIVVAVFEKQQDKMKAQPPPGN